MMDPETLLIVGLVGGVGAAATYATFHMAERLGPNLKAGDLLPMYPWEGPPLPRFTRTKPEVVAMMKKELFG